MERTDGLVEQVRTSVLAVIADERLEPGDRLPSERRLAEQLDVNRATLRQALAMLQEAGVVERRPGRSGGTYVSHPKVTRDLSQVTGLPAYLERQGYTSGTRVLSTGFRAVSEKDGEMLALPPDGWVAEVRRLRLADGSPLSLERAVFPAERFPGLLDRSLSASLYDVIRTVYGVAASEAHEDIEVVSARPDEAALLTVEVGAPLIMIRRTARDAEGTPFEWSQDLFRADRTRISVNLPGRGLRDLSTSGEIVRLHTC